MRGHGLAYSRRDCNPGAGEGRLVELADIIEFGIRRNLRVVGARVRGDLVAALQRIAPRFATGPRRSVYGVQMLANYADKTFRYCLWGTYGTRFTAHLDAVGQDFAFVDIGANQGLFSLIAARNPHCRAVIALEPVLTTWRLLKDNLAQNGAGDRAKPINAALSDRCGTAEIALKHSHSGMATLSEGRKFAGAATQTIELIDIARLDEMLPEDLPLIVKIDVEGHEEVVIDQLLHSRHLPQITTILCEIDERWIDAAAVTVKLREAGFTGFRKLGIRRHYDLLVTR